MDAKALLDRQYLEMRMRCLSLAADLDRIERAAGGPALLETDIGIRKLREALAILSRPGADRARGVQMIFSDRTAGPSPAPSAPK